MGKFAVWAALCLCATEAVAEDRAAPRSRLQLSAKVMEQLSRICDVTSQRVREKTDDFVDIRINFRQRHGHFRVGDVEATRKSPVALTGDVYMRHKWTQISLVLHLPSLGRDAALILPTIELHRGGVRHGNADGDTFLVLETHF